MTIPEQPVRTEDGQVTARRAEANGQGPQPASVTEDTWAVLALLARPQSRKPHIGLLEALRTFRPHPQTGIRSAPQDRLAKAAGVSVETLKRVRRDLAAWGVIWYKPGQGRGNNSEYWIIPVPPGREDPPKGVTNADPFLVPGTAGKGVTNADPLPGAGKRGQAPPVKGVSRSGKRGQPESADQAKRERKSTTLKSTTLKRENPGAAAAAPERARALLDHPHDHDQDPVGRDLARIKAHQQAALASPEVIDGTRKAIAEVDSSQGADLTDAQVAWLYASARRSGRVTSPYSYMLKILTDAHGVDGLIGCYGLGDDEPADAPAPQDGDRAATLRRSGAEVGRAWEAQQQLRADRASDA